MGVHLPDNVKELTAAHGATYDALCVLNPKVPAATVVAGPTGACRSSRAWASATTAST